MIPARCHFCGQSIRELSLSCPICGTPFLFLPRPEVTLLEGPPDRPQRWRIEWPDGSATEVKRSDRPMRLKVCDPAASHIQWTEVPNDGTLPSPNIIDTSD